MVSVMVSLGPFLVSGFSVLVSLAGFGFWRLDFGFSDGLFGFSAGF
ncbi:MAG: hypothetical protein ACRC8Q_02195 [Aeromonas sp.]